MIYLAPLQGQTDFIYRKVYSSVFQEIDGFFIPYISVKNQKVLKKYVAEVLPENNPKNRVIPQVLVKDDTEILFLTRFLKDFDYKEINLNLGCPYPMVTNRGKGAGLLPYPNKINNILDAFFKNSNLKLSVKLRAGLNSEKEIENVVPVLNRFPLTEVIFHPRIAKQLYKGKISDSAFSYAGENSKHKLVYNGDIFSPEDFREILFKYPNIKNWMLGRGILMNPFLPSEIKGLSFSSEEKKVKLTEFHKLIVESTLEKMDNEGNVLNKLKQFWTYFCFSFENPQKALKQIKKSNSIPQFLGETRRLFDNHIK